MKKWYFSNNGDITGPMNLEDAVSFAQQNPNIYAWHPTFTQWRPVTMISDFGKITSTVEPTANLLNELTEKFQIKKQRLEKKLSVIDQRMSSNEQSLSVLHAEIAQYKKLTANLSDGVKAAISKIEQHYLSMQEKQSMLNEAASIASMEMSTLVQEFQDRMNGNPSSSPKPQLTEKVEKVTVEEILIDDVDESLLSEITPSEGNQPSSPSPARQNTVKLVDVNASAATAEPKSNENTVQKRHEKTVIAKDVLIESHQPKSKTETTVDTKKGFNSVKGLFKSVFNHDDDVSKIQGNSLSKLLAMEEENARLAAEQANADNAKKA